MNFIEDKELNLKKEGNDLLNGKSYSETLKQIIQNTPKKGTFCIGLFGEWGSGKSSIIKTVKDDITKNKKEYGNTKFVIYDAWKYVNDIPFLINSHSNFEFSCSSQSLYEGSSIDSFNLFK